MLPRVPLIFEARLRAMAKEGQGGAFTGKPTNSLNVAEVSAGKDSTQRDNMPVNQDGTAKEDAQKKYSEFSHQLKEMEAKFISQTRKTRFSCVSAPSSQERLVSASLMDANQLNGQFASMSKRLASIKSSQCDFQSSKFPSILSEIQKEMDSFGTNEFECSLENCGELLSMLSKRIEGVKLAYASAKSNSLDDLKAEISKHVDGFGSCEASLQKAKVGTLNLVRQKSVSICKQISKEISSASLRTGLLEQKSDEILKRAMDIAEDSKKIQLEIRKRAHESSESLDSQLKERIYELKRLVSEANESRYAQIDSIRSIISKASDDIESQKRISRVNSSDDKSQFLADEILSLQARCNQIEEKLAKKSSTPPNVPPLRMFWKLTRRGKAKVIFVLADGTVV